MSAYNETIGILEKYKIKANKDLGQNFLINDDVIEKIIEKSQIEKNDLIIEIGPGLGVLTNLLLEKSDNVVAIELDKRMVEIISKRFILKNNLQIINEDVLKVDLNKLINERKKQTNINKVKIVANLPYYISTPIIIKLLEEKLEIDEIIVMVQKEVAQRLVAKTGTKDVGAITYAVEYFSEAEKVIDVPKESFIPSPKVESAVIKLKIRKEAYVQVKDEKMLFNIIQKSFSQRRKTLVNALVNGKIVESKEKAEKIIKKLNINENIRGEKLTLEDFARICNTIN